MQHFKRNFRRAPLICLAAGTFVLGSVAPAWAGAEPRSGSSSGSETSKPSPGAKAKALRASVEMMNKQLRRHSQRARAAMHALVEATRVDLYDLALSGASEADLTAAADAAKADVQSMADAAKAAIDAAAAKFTTTLTDRGAAQKLLDRLAQVANQSKAVCDKFAAKSCDHIDETLSELLSADEDESEDDDSSPSSPEPGSLSDCPTGEPEPSATPS